jgi:hypothetical protein
MERGTGGEVSVSYPRFPAMPRSLVALALLAVALPAFAQADKKETEEAVKKQKAAAVENLKVVKITKPVLVETDALLVYSELAEEKLKPIAEAAQKAHAQAVKDLKFGEKDRLWTGKLTVYVLADRPKEYTPFVKLVEARSGKLEADEMQTHSLKGEPRVAVTSTPGSKTPEAELRAEAMTGVVAAVVEQKAGAPLPTWVSTGVGKAVSYRTEGNGRLLEAHRTKVKGLFTRAKVGTFKAADVWGDAKVKDLDTLTVSLAEYLLYGADADATGKFLGGFRPSEERREPNVNTALDAAGWKADDLDLAWKKWVMGVK